MITYVARKILALEGVDTVGITDNGTIVTTLVGVDRHLREEIIDICKRAMMPASVVYKLENGQVVTEAQLDEHGTFALPLISYSNNMYSADQIDKLGVRGPIEPDTRWYARVDVPGQLGDTPEAPADEIAAPDGGQKLKRLRSKGRGRPVVGWKFGDKTVRKGSNLKALDHCSMQWTMGRILNVKPGTVAHVTELSTRRPVAFADIGEYTGVEIPVHMLGKMFDLVTDHGSGTTPKASLESKGSISAILKKEAPSLHELLGLGSVCEDDNLQLDHCGCDAEKDDEEEDLLLPPKKDPRRFSRKAASTKK